MKLREAEPLQGNVADKADLSSAARLPTSWRLRTRTLDLGRRTLVMGVVNVTPDSFSDGGLFLTAQDAVSHAMQLLEEGADLLDIGAESTRPGSGAGPANEASALSTDQEQARLLPVIAGILSQRPGALLSVDTYKAATASAALAAGAQIINDVSGFNWDDDMAAVCAQAGCGVVLMHTRGTPAQWTGQTQLEPDALMAAVCDGLQASLDRAIAAGVAHEAIVLDPGYGFGKRGAENFTLLARQRELLAMGKPLLAGVSRKSFLGQALAPLYAGKPAPIHGRETASVAAMVAAILHGASIVRVHSVRAAVEAALIVDQIQNQARDRI